MRFYQIILGTLAALLTAVSFSSCQKNEIVPNDVKSFYVVTTPYINRDSIFDGGQHIIFLGVGETATFLDASRGVEQRTWLIDGGEVLEKDNNQMVEDDSLIRVKYDTPGFFSVRLVASLDSTDLVYFETINDTAKDASGNVILAADGSDSVTCENCKLVPYAPNGTLDTTFTVQVFDSIQTDFSASQNGVTGDVFEAGVPVEFLDETKGTPYDWEWTFRGAEPGESTEQNPSVVWKTSGTYRITLRASRPYLEGDVRRDAQVITKEITITPSTAPLEYLSLSGSNSGDYIDLSFNQPLIEIPGTGEFTVEVNGTDFPIFKVSFPNSEDASTIRVELDGKMPPSSMFRVTSTTNILADGKNLNTPIDDKAYFKGTGNLYPEGFGDMEGITSAGVSVLPNTTRNNIKGLFSSGTINSEGAANGTETYWKRPWPLREDLTVNTEAESNEEFVLSGVYSCKWTPGDGNQMEQHPARGPAPDIVQGNTYEVVVWMKAEGNPGDVNVQWKKASDNVLETATNVIIPVGEWTRITIPYAGTEGGLHNLKFFNNATGVIYYIDEVGVFEQ